MIVNQDSGDSGLLLAVSSLPKRSRMHRKTKVESCSFISLLEILWTLYLSNLLFSNLSHFTILTREGILPTLTLEKNSKFFLSPKPSVVLQQLKPFKNLQNLWNFAILTKTFFKPFHRVSRFSKFPSEPEVMVQELELDPPHRYRPSSVAQLCQATG